LLGFLNQQPAHGYDLHERIEAELGQIWRIGLSQTYNILNRLETQGISRARCKSRKNYRRASGFASPPLAAVVLRIGCQWRCSPAARHPRGVHHPSVVRLPPRAL